MKAAGLAPLAHRQLGRLGAARRSAPKHPPSPAGPLGCPPGGANAGGIQPPASARDLA